VPPPPPLPAGQQLDRSTITYEVTTDDTDKVFGLFSALGIVAFTFGDTILPEIQYTVKVRPGVSCRRSRCDHGL
jgi:hypothetical protein